MDLHPVEDIPDTIQAERLYTVNDASKILGMATGHWLYDQIKAGRIPYVDLNPGGQRPKIRIRATTINNLINDYTITPLGAAA